MKVAPPRAVLLRPASEARLAAARQDYDADGQALCEAEIAIEVNTLVPEANTPLRNQVFSMGLEIIRRQTCGEYTLADLVYARQVVALLVASRRMCDPSVMLTRENLEEFSKSSARRALASEARDVADTVRHLNESVRLVLEEWRAFRRVNDLPVPRARRGPPLREVAVAKGRARGRT